MNGMQFFKNFQPLFDSKDETKAAKKEVADKKAAKETKVDSKKPANVKESAADFFRKYSDIIAEAEDQEPDGDPYEERKLQKEQDDKEHAADVAAKRKKEKESVKESYDDEDEDEDVKAADKVKGKDNKTQKDSEKGKKWNFDKADKKDEDKGAKKAKDELEEAYRNVKKMVR